MCFPFFGELKRFLDRHPRLPQAAALREGFAAALAACDLEKILELYGEVLELAERLLWQEGAGEEALEASQALFREYEQLLAQRGEDERHRFVVVIPVADRPGSCATAWRACWRSAKPTGTAARSPGDTGR